ncbi:thiosulfate/3-mercaptopyruvate sulfurtransferase [Natronorubrum sediminis]|uniref:Thiosulfate/3-mercaptopyruvate sulfurtransferase n=1 Tax=Natronorubrum sediminis TaxID=640943 RepID=A0A1H6G882_9EURY|nr:sulfurtransferase [Natronorubrum sediminis]SEH18194.1 thiosulfate/3-mercaptopyruvate sulfurtransferase [Natronorubrum sediminis]
MTDADVPQLVEPSWLEGRLHEPDLQVIDCTVHLNFDPETGARRTESGRSDWEQAHIPGSVFVDIPTDVSVTDDPAYPYQLPSSEQFAEAMSRLGVGDDRRVVLYDSTGNGWAARVWWLLRTFGFTRAGVLNGGFTTWTAQNRPVSDDQPSPSRATFTPDVRPRLIADKDDVLAGIDDEECCLINGLRPADHEGSGLVKYGRPGRIPSSVNVPAVGETAIVDPETARYQSLDELRGRFGEVGALDAERVIAYCGGGIAASSVAFALTLLSVDDVAVYDGSLAEWGRDESCPMVINSNQRSSE